MTSNIDARMVFENAKNALRKAFPNVGNIAEICKLTQNAYRFEQALAVGQTLYTFPVLNNEAIFSNTEQRLRQQDSAVVYSLGVFVGLPASSTDTAWIPKTYESPFIFGADSVPLRALWNGSLSIAVNNDILTPNWDLFRHYCAPQTQQAAALGAGSFVDELHGQSDGFYPVEPNIVMVGSKNNVISINLPAGLSSAAANSRIIIIARAITAQNSTVVS